MEFKENSMNEGTKAGFLRYLFKYGKENKYRLARVFKIGTEEVITVLSALKNEGKIKMEGSKARLIIKPENEAVEQSSIDEELKQLVELG